jgi:hypothetical protein
MKEIIEFPKLKFQGLELVEYGYKEGHETFPIKITEFFPKIFKFRSLDILKEDVYLCRKYE